MLTVFKMDMNTKKLQPTIEELTKTAHQRGNDIEIRSAKDGKIKVYEVKKTLVGIFEPTKK